MSLPPANSEAEDFYKDESFEEYLSEDDEVAVVASDYSSASHSESETELREFKSQEAKSKFSANASSHRLYGGKNFNRRKYPTYSSSSEEEEDVVISETIAEVNNLTLIMEDAPSSERTLCGNSNRKDLRNEQVAKELQLAAYNYQDQMEFVNEAVEEEEEEDDGQGETYERQASEDLPSATSEYGNIETQILEVSDDQNDVNEPKFMDKASEDYEFALNISEYSDYQQFQQSAEINATCPDEDRNETSKNSDGESSDIEQVARHTSDYLPRNFGGNDVLEHSKSNLGLDTSAGINFTTSSFKNLTDFKDLLTNLSKLLNVPNEVEKSSEVNEPSLPRSHQLEEKREQDQDQQQQQSESDIKIEEIPPSLFALMHEVNEKIKLENRSVAISNVETKKNKKLNECDLIFAEMQNAVSAQNVDGQYSGNVRTGTVPPRVVNQKKLTYNEDCTAIVELDEGDAQILQDDCDLSTKYEYEITSETPTSFNTDDYAFHVNLMRPPSSTTTNKFSYKNLGRKSFSFSNERVREIERQNKILLKKMMSVKPTVKTVKPKKSISQTKCAAVPSGPRITSAAVNRKNQQRQIDNDNTVLKRKLEEIGTRRRIY